MQLWSPPPFAPPFLLFSPTHCFPLKALESVFLVPFMSLSFPGGSGPSGQSRQQNPCVTPLLPPLLPSHRISRIESRQLCRATAGTLHALGRFTAARSGFCWKKYVVWFVKITQFCLNLWYFGYLYIFGKCVSSIWKYISLHPSLVQRVFWTLGRAAEFPGSLDRCGKPLESVP